jgi:hypothetical protein
MDTEQNSGANKTAMIGGILVTEEVYEYHQREVSKLIKERDKAEERRDLYRYLSFFLLGLFVLVVVLQRFEK